MGASLFFVESREYQVESREYQVESRVLHVYCIVFVLFLKYLTTYYDIYSVSQIGTPETLIGRKSAILRRWLVCARCIPYDCYGFGLAGRDSDKLRNELHG